MIGHPPARDAIGQAPQADKSWYFKSAPMFAGAGAPLLARLAAVSTMRRVRPGRHVYLAGDRADTVYLVKEGEVRLVRLGPDGEEMTIALLGPLDVLGERAIAGDEARDETAIAVLPSLICDIPRAEFLAVVASCPPLWVNLFRLFALRTARLESRITDLVFKGAEARLCTVLVTLARDHGTERAGGSIEIAMRLTGRDLAHLAGLTRPTASTLLSSLRDEGLVETGLRRLCLVRPSELARRAHLADSRNV